jgi:3-isopropylmalate/(R)-2-methylmalate dehydratase small subunit
MIRGRAWRFMDDVDTDAIIPGRYLDDYSPENLAKHAMEGADPSFASKVKRGDIIVAGKRFGIGSSREQAPIALKAAGIEVILAESFARIFYRNAVNQGMLPLVCPGCGEAFGTGETISVDAEKGMARSEDRPGKALKLQEMSPYIFRIYSAGGLVRLLRSELGTAEGDNKNK